MRRIAYQSDTRTDQNAGIQPEYEYYKLSTAVRVMTYRERWIQRPLAEQRRQLTEQFFTSLLNPTS